MASFNNQHNNYPNQGNQGHNNQGHNNSGGGGGGGSGGNYHNNNKSNSGYNNSGGGRGGGRGRSSNNFDRGGGRGRSSSGGRGGFNSGGGGFDRGGRNSGGRGGFGGGPGDGGRGGGPGGGSDVGIIRPCSNWTQSGQCPRGDTCTFGHIVQLHGIVDVSNGTKPPNPQQQQQQNYRGANGNQSTPSDVSSMSVWDNNGMIKIFTGSYDGYWRLWNTTGGQFMKEFEHFMGLNSKIYHTVVMNQFLFVAFESIANRMVPDVAVGMIHVWNLQNPALPPYELYLHDQYIPYAAGQAVTILAIEIDPNTGHMLVASGSKDGSIRLWTFNGEKFILSLSLIGHSGQVTGLILLPMNQLLWSCSIDGCIRIWNIQTGDNQYCIAREIQPPPCPPVPAQQPPLPVGHTNAVTSLVLFNHIASGGTYILSSSLDRTIKVWNALSGECVANESHSSGIVSMCITKDMKMNDILLIGLENGNIQCRNLMPSGTIQSPFQMLFTLNSRYSAGHTDGPVQCIIGGPSSTFYSGGTDGKMLIFSMTGDLGL